jgi:hypothetical protein
VTFTVKVIFWGLIALAPLKQGNEIMALLANGGDHIAQVYLLKGRCTGDCFHNLPRVSSFELVWRPYQEQLQIAEAGPPIQLAHGTRRNFLGRPDRFPGSLIESSDLSWIPEMDIVTGDKRTLKSSCLGNASECPISARFLVDKGQLSACHLLHKENNQAEAFTFKPHAGSAVSDFYQASADAVAQTFGVQGSSITLKALTFTGSETASATLEPEDGELVLLVGNFPFFPIVKAPSRPPQGSESHFPAFYELLTNPPSKPPFRHHTLVFQHTEPGSCEPYVSELERPAEELQIELEGKGELRRRAVRGKDDKRMPPHLSTECDMVMLSPQ